MRILNYALSAISFVLLAGLIIAYASGYKINLSTRNLSQTAVIDVQPDINDAQVSLNNQVMGNGHQSLRYLSPGHYDLKVSKDGYHDWTKSLDLKRNEAVVLNDIVMFKQSPEQTEFDFNGGQDSISKISDTDNLRTSGGEIYQNDALVTRLSTDIKGLCWYTDRRYLAFTSNGALKIIQIDGTNEVDLFQKNSDGPVVFVNSGRSVIYESNGKIYRSQIR